MVAGAALGLVSGAWCDLHDVHLPIIPTARTQKTEWNYTTADPGAGWYDTSYDASAWTTDLAGFGARFTPHSVVSTEWSTDDIWLRKTFTVSNPEAMAFIALEMHHDEGVEVFINGSLVEQDTGYTTDYETRVLSADSKALLRDGQNLIALHCHQTTGGQYIDVGLSEIKSVELTTILPFSRTEPQEWMWSTEEPGTSNWTSASYSEDRWTPGNGAFGSEGTPGGTVGTPWLTSDIWIRKVVTLPETGFSDYLLTVFHDEDVEVFINGLLALQNKDYVTADLELIVSDTIKSALKPGPNIIAVHCHQTLGGQFLDVGLMGVPAPTVGIVHTGKAGKSSAPLLTRFPSGSFFRSGNRFFDLSGRSLSTQSAKRIPFR